MARLTDEIVDEIHAVRVQHAAALGNDMERILDDLSASQQRRVMHGWPLVKTSDTPPIRSFLQRAKFTSRLGQ